MYRGVPSKLSQVAYFDLTKIEEEHSTGEKSAI